MVKSMTGYGRGEMTAGTLAATVEVRSVNNRYLDCNVKLPRTCLYAEEAVKERVASQLNRGKVDVFVNLDRTGGENGTVTVNEPMAMAYMRAMKRLYDLDPTFVGQGGKMSDVHYSLVELARFPDVLVVEKQEEDQKAVQAVILEALDMALVSLSDMRAREGRRLTADLLSRCDRIEDLVEIVEERSPDTVAEYRMKLAAKMREVLESTQIDEARILTEAAIFADKVAVDEETVRLRSHLEQMREMLEDGGPIGRKLDFLIQELNREANTIGSKCSDLSISRKVVDIKAEIEKIREQVQNIE